MSAREEREARTIAERDHGPHLATEEERKDGRL